MRQILQLSKNKNTILEVRKLSVKESKTCILRNVD